MKKTPTLFALTLSLFTLTGCPGDEGKKGGTTPTDNIMHPDSRDIKSGACRDVRGDELCKNPDLD